MRRNAHRMPPRALALLMTFTWVAPASAATEVRLTSTSTDSETGLNHTPLCLDSQNRLHFVWAEQDGPRGNYQIHERVRVNDQWQPSTLVVPYRAEFPGSLLGVKFPSLVRGAGDTLHLAWHDYRIDGINNAEIFYKKTCDNAPWDSSIVSEVRLTTSNHPETNGDNSYVPTLYADRSGVVHLAWYDFRFDGSAAEILYKVRRGGAWDTTPGDAPDLNVSNTAGDSQFPAMVVDVWGRVHVAWQDDSSGNHRILYSIRTMDNGPFAAPEAVTTHAQAAVAPAMTVDGTGRVTLAWVDARDGSRRIYTRRREWNGVWSPERAATPNGYNADEPALAADEFGQVHLAWHDTRISALNREVFLQSAPAGADFDATGARDVRVSNGTGSSTRPSLLADPGGWLYVVWKDRRDGNNEIYFSEFALSSPVAVGEEGLAAGRTLRLAAGPNPFRTSTTVFLPASPRGTFDTGLPVTPLRIVTAAGRLVRAADVSGDRYEWDGRDERGAVVPPGVYFIGVPRDGVLDRIRVVKAR